MQIKDIFSSEIKSIIVADNPDQKNKSVKCQVKHLEDTNKAK